MNIAKKIIATIVGLSTVMMMAPGIAQGTTTEELQAQINALLAQITALQAQLAAAGGTTGGTVPAACVGITLTRNLSKGSTGSDVKCVQALLNTDASTQVAVSGAGSLGNETTYYGSLTVAAVKKFQAKYGTGSLGTCGVNTRAKMNEILAAGTGTGGTTPPPSGAGQDIVSLASDTPAAKSIARGAQDVIFAKINFCAASAANTVSKIVISRTGVAQDSDISNVKLYDGATQVGSTQAINTTLHQASFASLSVAIPANSCKTLAVKASIAAGATAGDTPKMEITSASDITSTIALSGTFPIASNYMTIAGISVGALNVATTTPSGNVVAGGTQQGVAGFTLTASGTEGVKLESIKITEVGSSVDTDVANIKLFYQSTQLGSTVPSLTNGAATFDLSAAPLEILAGNSKDLTVYVDIGTATGIKDRTIQFEITDKTHITAYGTNSGGTVVAYGGSGNWTTATDPWPQKAAPITINLGSLTVAADSAYAPSSTDYSRGSNDNKIYAFKFTAGANEGIRITQIKFKSATGTALLDSDVSNIKLYDVDGTTRIKDTAGNDIPAASMVSGFVTFGSYSTGLDTTGLFDITKSSYKTIIVKADIPSAAATGTNLLGFIINNPTTDVKADGLASANDIASSLINGNVTTQVPTTSVLHNIIEKGTLTVAGSPSTPAAATYAIGTSNFTIAKFDLTSTGEDIKVTNFNVYFGTSTNATGTDADSADLNNIRLYDGETLLGTDSQISSGYAEFSVNLTVPKNSTKTLSVVVDIPSGSDAAVLQAWVQKKGDISAQGVGSNVTIYATAASWASVRGNAMTKGTPTLTVKAATTPATQTYIKNAVDVEVLQLLLTATPTEDIKITRMQILADATSATTTAGVATTTFNQPDGSGVGTGLGTTGQLVKDYIGNMKLFDGATQIGTVVSQLTDGTRNDYADFTGLSLVVPKGTTKVISVKVQVLKSTTTTGTVPAFYFGMGSTTDVGGSGNVSGTAVTVVMESNAGTAGQPMYFGDSGTLVVSASASMPNSAIVKEGTTATMGKWTFTPANEAMTISRLRFDVHQSVATSGTFTVNEREIWLMATSGKNVDTRTYALNYAVDGNATTVCSFAQGRTLATSSDEFIARINSSASSTCNATGATNGIIAYNATDSSTGAVTLYASSGRSLMLTPAPNGYGGGSGSTTFAFSLRTGTTDTISRYAGADGNVVSGKVAVWNGTTKIAETSLSGLTQGAAIFDGMSINLPKNAATVLTLTVDIADYTSAVEGSTMYFSIGSTTDPGGVDSDYITAVGVSSGSTVASSSITLDAEKASNEMWVYSTSPKLSLNASSPSGAQTVGTNKEVFRFDVQNTGSLNLDINAIRFTLSTNASSAITDKVFNLYKSDDLTTIIGKSVSWASATSSATIGYVAIHPTAGNTISAGDTITYVLKANTSNMNEGTAKTELLTVSIEDGDFYWDDTSSIVGAAMANQKVPGLPVTGNTLSY